jgi:hypothetical protein
MSVTAPSAAARSVEGAIVNAQPGRMAAPHEKHLIVDPPEEYEYVHHTTRWLNTITRRTSC